MELALLEAVQWIGLDTDIGLGPCGPIYIMGFDTNNPCGHTDWPPHIHLHMAKPSYGAPIGHYYFDHELKFSHNEFYLRKVETEVIRFERDEPCPHYTPEGALLFDLMITTSGGLLLTSANNKSVQIEPRDKGFETGAVVTKNGMVKHVNTHTDNGAGMLKVCLNDIITSYAFDKDTGAYLGVVDDSTMTGGDSTQPSGPQVDPLP